MLIKSHISKLSLTTVKKTIIPPIIIVILHRLH